MRERGSGAIMKFVRRSPLPNHQSTQHTIYNAVGGHISEQSVYNRIKCTQTILSSQPAVKAKYIFTFLHCMCRVHSTTKCKLILEEISPFLNQYSTQKAQMKYIPSPLTYYIGCKSKEGRKTSVNSAH